MLGALSVTEIQLRILPPGAELAGMQPADTSFRACQQDAAIFLAPFQEDESRTVNYWI